MTPSLNQKSIIVAIDGPAASGKGTLARRIAAHYGWRHLDTGLTYRAVANELLKNNSPLEDERAIIAAAHTLDLSNMDRTALAQHAVGEAASKIAIIPALRKTLVDVQRAFAHANDGAVLDGRDIGTVVCPDAPVKLYVTASADVRAKRRYHEIMAGGGAADEGRILQDIKIRDERDMNRSDSPLKPAQDAHLLDTSDMTIEAAFNAARSIIDAALDT
ncbi:MAG: (d)CMP kinase [Pseudomonadota bacterium]